MRGLIFATVLAFASPAFAQSSELESIIAEYTALSREAAPIQAAQHGDRAAATVWADNSPAAVARRRAALDGIAARLSRLSADGLNERDALEREVLIWRVGLQQEGYRFDEERMPFRSGEGFFIDPDYASTITILNTEADAEAWLTRMGAIPALFARETENMRRGMRTRFTQPRVVVQNALESVQAQAALPDAESPLLVPLARLPNTIPEARRVALQRRGAEIYAAQVKPALQQLAVFLEREYMPRARRDTGIRGVPNGRAYYAYLVRRHTTTDMTPEEVHALGEREVARIHREMEAIIAEVGFDGSINEFIESMRNRPELRARDVDDLMRFTAEVMNRANFELPRYFGTLPRTTVAATFMPSALEGGSSGYWPGNPEAGAAGQVLLRRGSAEGQTLYAHPAWIMHEGSPGHHIQVTLAQENQAIPQYRRDDEMTAFVEGWALYAEQLGYEMGIYRTPYERFGQLTMQMWRACRLVTDTGMHVMGMSREAGIACLRDNGALGPRAAEGETDRYLGWPGQALGYKVGELQIRDMRARAEERLGACFDIRAFHDELLGAGALPMAILERRMDRWVAAQSCAASQ